MDEGSIGRREHDATRMAFYITGVGMAGWAPLVPYAKARLGVDDGALGLLLLCMGAGSLLAMPMTGALVGRIGCRRAIVMAGTGICAALPLLAVAGTPLVLGAALFLFGASLGLIDVALNIQAVIVEKAAGRPMMSGFHGLFSLGCIVGAGGVSGLLWLGASPAAATVGIAVLLLFCLGWARGGLLPGSDDRGEKPPLFMLPRGRVLVIGILCFIMFLAEGAMLDWSALFLTTVRRIDPAYAGLGYAFFAVAMTTGRLTGDRIVGALGPGLVITAGGTCAAVGLLTAVLIPSDAAALLGFLLVGLGASNVVPILFTAAGRQPEMVPSFALAGVTTLGYAGMLAGPALIGLVTEVTSLSLALGAVGVLVLLVAAGGRSAIAPQAGRTGQPLPTDAV